MLTLLIKFGILEFLLNNMLQKKIKIVLKVLNICLYDFIESAIISKLNKVNSNNNGGSSISLPKNIQDEISIFNSLSKKYQTKSLNTWTFEYQMKLYENKILNQLKVFLE